MINLKALRIYIKGWTASFRYPIFISGFQPTLPVPPLSTIYGILSAVKGDVVTPDDVKVGYIFKSSGKFVDLETLYELDDKNVAKSNVCKRETLADPELYIYLDDLSYAPYFRNPSYPILLGRSQDIAMVKEVKEVELEIVDSKVYFGGTTVPFPTKHVHGLIQALPTHFTDTIPRKAVGTRPYHVLGEFMNVNIDECCYDGELKMGVYLHALSQ